MSEDYYAFVRFADGHVNVAYVHDDPPILVPLLFDIADRQRILDAGSEALGELVDLAEDAQKPEDAEPVEIWIPYPGDGYSWSGEASRDGLLLTSGAGPVFDRAETPEVQQGPVEWAEEAQASPLSDVSAPLTHPMAAPGRAGGPVVVTELPPPLDEDSAFMAAADRLMGGHRDGLLLERFLEGLLARAAHDPAELAHRLAPVLPEARRRGRAWKYHVSLVGDGLLELVGAPRSDDHIQVLEFAHSRDHMPFRSYMDLGVNRCAEVIWRVRSRQGGPLLSMPTERSGALDDAVLEKRLEKLDKVHAHTFDLAGARSRAGAGVPLDVEPPTDAGTLAAIVPFSPRQLFVLTEREMFAFMTCGLFAMLAPIVRPGQVGPVAMESLPLLVGDVDREPSGSHPSLLGAFCAQLAVEDAADRTAALLCALGLASGPPATSDPAMDLLGNSSPGWLDQLVPAEVALAVEAGVAKLRRVIATLERHAADAPETVQVLALHLSSFMIDQGHRDTGRLLELACDVSEIAGAARIPDSVADLAASKAKTKAAREARRLVSILSDS